MLSPSPARAAGVVTTVAALLATALSAVPAAAVPGTGSTVFVNEIHYDNAGADTAEAIEVAAPAGTDLAAWALVLVNGATGAEYGRTALVGPVADQQNGYGTASVAYPANGIQNGAPDAIALVNGDQVVQLLSYEGVVTWNGVTSTDIGVAENGSETPGQSLRLTGSGRVADDFSWTGPAPASAGAPNAGQALGSEPGPNPDPEPEHDPVARLLSAVQGPGEASPLAGQSVIVEAVVTSVLLGDALGNQLGGFFIEEEAADRDADPATSEGVFVIAGAGSSGSSIAAGDVVRVSGTVAERFGQTQITAAAGGISVVGSADPPPTVDIATLPDPTAAARAAAWEPLEGMRVRLAGTWSVTDNVDVHRFGELELVPGTQPLQSPTNVMSPGLQAAAAEDAIAGGFASLTLDDTRDGELNPNPAQPARVVLPAPYVAPAGSGTVRRGSTLSDQVAVLSYGFDAWRLRPIDSEASITIDRDVRPPAPRPVGDLTYTAFNVLNYFNGDGDGTGFPTSRGARTPEEFQRQQAKIAAAAAALDVDVLGLIEIENDGDTARPAIAELVEALNVAFAGARSYAAVDTGRLGGDAITNALVYDTREVRLEGWAALDDVDPFTRNTRPPLAGRFTDLGTGEQVVPIVNHFKSKGSGDGVNADANDGQGASNPDRVLAATELLRWIDGDPFFTEDDRVLVTGDLNSYALEDPIVTLETGGLTDLLDTTDPAAYTYAFSGAEGRLDHALGNAAAVAAVTSATPWPVNADEPRSKEYGQAFNQPELYAADPYRSSDHDPVVVGLELGPDRAVADLAVDVEALVRSVPAGTLPLLFTVTARNNGPDVASGVVVDHTTALPGGAQLVYAYPSRGTSFDAESLRWSVGELAPGESTQLFVVVRASRSSTGTASLTAGIGGESIRDGAGDNDADTAQVRVTPRRR